MLEVILSFVGGGGLAIVTELLNYFDRKNQRSHELALMESKRETAEEETLGKVSAGAGTPMDYPKTGYGILDAFLAFMVVLNASVRPILTYWWVLVMYTAYKVALYQSMSGEWYEIVQQLWTPADMSIVVCIISFWFVARQLRKKYL